MLSTSSNLPNKHRWQERKDSNRQPSAPTPAVLGLRFLASRARDPANDSQSTTRSAQRRGAVRIGTKSRLRACPPTRRRCLATMSHVSAQLPRDPYVLDFTVLWCNPQNTNVSPGRMYFSVNARHGTKLCFHSCTRDEVMLLLPQVPRRGTSADVAKWAQIGRLYGSNSGRGYGLSDI
jgi:hypothetical protein